MVRIPHDAENHLLDELKHYSQTVIDEGKVSSLLKYSESDMSKRIEYRDVSVDLGYVKDEPCCTCSQNETQ